MVECEEDWELNYEEEAPTVHKYEVDPPKVVTLEEASLFLNEDL